MKRNPSHVVTDLRRWLALLAVARAANCPSAIAHCEQEAIAMERELKFCRYGRTDVI